MILIDATIKYSGVNPNLLKPKSHKRICVICNQCERIRWVEFYQYRDLCKSCAGKNKKLSDEAKRNIGLGKLGENNPQYGKTGKNSTFYNKHHSDETKKKMSKAKKKYIKNNPYCRSGENNPMWGRTGKNHPNYNSNITDEERILGRKYPEYYEWRSAIYKRDNYTCQKCNDSTGGNLNAHHIESYTNNPNLRIILENGITLCEDCHKDFHHYYGYGNNTKVQFNEFMGNNEIFDSLYFLNIGW